MVEAVEGNVRTLGRVAEERVDEARDLVTVRKARDIVAGAVALSSGLGGTRPPGPLFGRM